ncbi:DNA ligase (NAD(+)) LigA [Lujinxingia vulgaris]|uniref:DNA ligase n=2 Tax=Lujinxingia vulgaris TaxID=2600176 RepID=A0A5C6X5L7_9DELT|nr:DNA ligase (NAD(+)) LigA [Lujinxingia vulgaris]
MTRSRTMSAPTWEDLSIDELEEQVRYHNRKYWVDDAPEISDESFDRLVEVLRRKAPGSEVLNQIGPAGADVDAIDPNAEKLTHDPPMLSLDKAYDEATLLKWYEKFEGDVVVTPKVDGVAGCFRYDAQGRLSVAATRGTGTVGEVITEQVRRIKKLPLEVDASSIEVRGEAYMPVEVFERKFKHDYASPRNLTAGALKLKDPEKTADYELRFFAFDLLGEDFESEAEKMARLKALGFETPETFQVNNDAIQATYDDIARRRSQLGYETDGVVYKANSIAEQKRLGSTAHHPRWAIAYKFQGDAGESVLRDVVWNVSRTGAINPVGIVDPVVLSGATVTRVSLHNLAIMEHLGGEEGLTLGSKVLMMRRGGVIPNLEQVLEAGDEPVVIPSECPECGAPTERQNDVLMAHHSENCRAAKIRQIEHFVSRMEIKGFGPKLLEQLYDAELVTSPVDLFTLSASELMGLDRVGEILANKLIERIEGRKEVEVEKFLQALGIHELGKHVSAILAERYDSMDDIRAVDAEAFAEVHTIGEVIAASVTRGLQENAELIDDLLEHITLVFPTPREAPAVEGSPLAGKRVLFTGAMESMTRKDAQAEVEKRGGDCPSSVVKDLDYLVMGDADMERFEGGWRSSKLKKAEKFNAEGGEIAIVGESTFLKLLEEGEG